MKSPFKIGLLSPMGNGNLGDAAIQDAVLHNIRRYLPDAKIFGLSENPVDTEQRHNIKSFPIHRSNRQAHISDCADGKEIEASGNNKSGRILTFGRRVINALLRRFNMILDEFAFLRASFHIVKDIDLLIISGGGQLGDFWGGCLGHPYTLFKWIMLCRAAGTNVVFMSIGADIIQSRISKLFIKYSLHLSSYNSFRDNNSLIFAERLGLKRHNGVYPDLAFSFPLPITERTDSRAEERIPVIGLSPINADAWTSRDCPLYTNFLHELTSFTIFLVENGHNVELFPSQVKMDTPVMKELQEAVILRQPKSPCGLRINSAVNVEELIRQISKVDIVIASRLHGVLLSLLMKKPVLALSYNPKVRALMEDIGLSQYCIDVDCFDYKTGVETFEQIVADRNAIEEHLDDQVRSYRQSLDVQYRHILGIHDPVGSEVMQGMKKQYINPG